MFTAEVEGVEEVQEAWKEALGDIARGMNTGVQFGVEEGAAQAKATHRYKDRTGALTGSIRGYLVASASPTDNGEAVGVLEAKAKHASYIEEGTPPHEIEARRAELLRWVDEGGGVHFARKVNHPGGPSLPFMGPAAQKAERVVEVEVERAVERAAERFR